ncbi:MAG TPA: TonB-dependent receptor, partial [Cyclobacteriaceae bacterium]
MKEALILIFSLISTICFAQRNAVSGRVYNKVGNEPVPFANIVVQGTSVGVTADESGAFIIPVLQPGLYNLEATFIGFKKLVVFEVQVTTARTAIVDFALEEEARKLDEVIISSGNTFIKPDESPLSLRTIGTTEIKRTPGGNRDVSKVIRSLPGVASTPSFRNDIIIRGGSPSENSFYLDGIQIPVINHFQTQGSSGGPVGIINVDLLREVSFYSGAFPANRGNTMSSVFDFSLKDGRDDRWTANGIIGATDLGITLEGPVNKKSSLVFSARRSYLQFLFEFFNLPFLPVYNDLQFKYKVKLNEKNQFTLLGVGAIDDFSLNLNAPDNIDDPKEKEEAEYILNALPVSEQWNYTIGMKYEHFRKGGTSMVVLSQNMLNNSAIKYKNNDGANPDNLIQDYNSRETETKLRIEDYLVKNTW